jgi:hypothetical protein
MGKGVTDMPVTKKVTLADVLSMRLLNKRYNSGEAIIVDELLTKEQKQLDREFVETNRISFIKGSET